MLPPMSATCKSSLQMARLRPYHIICQKLKKNNYEKLHLPIIAPKAIIADVAPKSPSKSHLIFNGIL
jgi:hypothetical protein